MATDRLINLILLFFAYAFLGWCIEVTLKYFQFHRFINRGFLTGPWLPQTESISSREPESKSKK